MSAEAAVDLSQHHKPENLSDHFALLFVKFLRIFADTFFAKRYGHRAIVLETVAAIPGMVAGALQHLRALRRVEDDQGWIRVLPRNYRNCSFTINQAVTARTAANTMIRLSQPIQP